MRKSLKHDSFHKSVWSRRDDLAFHLCCYGCRFMVFLSNPVRGFGSLIYPPVKSPGGPLRPARSLLSPQLSRARTLFPEGNTAPPEFSRCSSCVYIISEYETPDCHRRQLYNTSSKHNSAGDVLSTYFFTASSSSRTLESTWRESFTRLLYAFS